MEKLTKAEAWEAFDKALADLGKTGLDRGELEAAFDEAQEALENAWAAYQDAKA